VIALMFLVFPLAKAALKFSSPEFFSLMCMSMIMLTYIGSKSFVKAIVMILIGLVLSTVGVDSITSKQRFAFGYPVLFDGIGMVPMPWASSEYQKFL